MTNVIFINGETQKATEKLSVETVPGVGDYVVLDGPMMVVHRTLVFQPASSGRIHIAGAERTPLAAPELWQLVVMPIPTDESEEPTDAGV